MLDCQCQYQRKPPLLALMNSDHYWPSHVIKVLRRLVQLAGETCSQPSSVCFPASCGGGWYCCLPVAAWSLSPGWYWWHASIMFLFIFLCLHPTTSAEWEAAQDGCHLLCPVYLLHLGFVVQQWNMPPAEGLWWHSSGLVHLGWVGVRVQGAGGQAAITSIWMSARQKRWRLTSRE